jgi:HTH-type transcriptional regulator/antitoxin HigA
MTMKLKPIRNDRELNRALKRIDELWGAKSGSPRGDELDVLMLLVEKYEDENFAIPASDPIEAIRFLMEQNQLTRKDLEPYLGKSGRVSEVLNRKRNLTLAMIKKLHKGLKIPYESLIH